MQCATSITERCQAEEICIDAVMQSNPMTAYTSKTVVSHKSITIGVNDWLVLEFGKTRHTPSVQNKQEMQNTIISTYEPSLELRSLINEKASCISCCSAHLSQTQNQGL